MILHSIKWRLQLWHGFLLACVVTGLMVGFYAYERRSRLQAIDRQLHEAAAAVMPRPMPPERRPRMERPEPDVESPGARRSPPPPQPDGPAGPRRELRPGFDGPPELREPVTLPADPGKFYYIVWAGGDEPMTKSTNAPVEMERPRPGRSPASPLLRSRGLDREVILFAPPSRCVLVGTSLGPRLAGLKKLAAELALIGAGIVTAAVLVGWWLAARALRPIAAISRTAQEIAAGDLSRRINTSETESELGRLATVLNSTFARLEAAFAQQQQFTSDAAHELRTPVSVILAQVQSTLNKERTGVEYRETLEACQRAAQRMRRLIESLLELARFDAGQEKLKRLEFDVASTARDCAELIQPLAQERRVSLVTELAPTRCVGDPERVGQVITNLLTNAVLYNKEGGEVRLTTRAENGAPMLTVSDTGVGISNEDLPHVFDRFYRADKSRAHGNSRTGLGLAIAKAVVEAHGGELEVASVLGQGTTFTVRFAPPDASGVS